MPPSSGELWGYNFMPANNVVYCLLPTGILVPLEVRRDKPLYNLKDDLWTLAKDAGRFPFGHLLGEPSQYIFQGVTQDGVREDFYDESRRFCDLRLHEPYLQLREPHGNKDEKMFNQYLSSCIGLQMRDLDDLRDPEVVDFRLSMVRVCERTIALRERSDDTRLEFMYPAELDSSPQLERITSIGRHSMSLSVLVSGTDVPTIRLNISGDLYPEGLVEEMWRRVYCQVYRMSDSKSLQSGRMQRDKFILKAAGRKLYFTARRPLCQYRYIRMCMVKGETPQLVLMSRESVCASIPPSSHLEPMYARRAAAVQDPAASPTNCIRLHDVHDPFSLSVLGAQYLNVADVDRLYVTVGVYLGATALCDTAETDCVGGDRVPMWNKSLSLSILVQDLPSSSKLCLGVIGVSKRKKKEEHFMLAWCNLSLFDYRSHLLSGKKKLQLWPVPKGQYVKLFPMEIVGPNPSCDPNVAWLEIDLPSYSKPVQLPGEEVLLELGAAVEAQLDPEPKTTVDISQRIREVACRDPLSEITVQDAELLWAHRHYCRTHMPHALPKLLDAVKWDCRRHVAQLYQLLSQWPCVDVDVALELLSSRHRDLTVRQFAVRCLSKLLTDDRLSQYLIQLVHTIKHEPYLDNALTRFILEKALRNRHIGYFLFWHLKSDVHTSGYTQRVGLLLEAYCRGLGQEHIKSLCRQVQCLDKIFILTESLKEMKDEAPKERHRYLCERVRQSDYLESIQHMPSPLCPHIQLGEILVEESKIMDSARRPLWLSWSNADETLQHCETDSAREHLLKSAIIFKNGDDLRQDMLTLQVIKIMDHKWDEEGLDLRMTPYSCLATGNLMGMIEVVRNAKTVYRIQREASKLAAIQVDSSQLHKWIRDHNPGVDYDTAIETFTRSCAGYCVATFVLGIGDRHPDNIMVNHQGQIFHIDFGHFLGHFKKKFGISRERVPFVLTDDFLMVIARGADNPKKSKAFQDFQELCGKAYLALRKHSHLFITLFTMMLSTGITELQGTDDISYLRKTLQVEVGEEEALAHFQYQFNEAYGGAWTTKLDWFFHSVKHM